MLRLVSSQFRLICAGRHLTMYLFSKPMCGREYRWMVPDSRAMISVFLDAAMQQIASSMRLEVIRKFSMVCAGEEETCEIK